MKKMFLIIAMFMAFTANAMEPPKEPSQETWAVVHDGGSCYSFRVNDWVAPKCYESIEEAYAVLKVIHAKRLEQLAHEAKPWKDVPSSQDAKNTAEVF